MVSGISQNTNALYEIKYEGVYNEKKAISLIMVILLAVSYLTVLAVADAGIEAENDIITAELQSVMDSATATYHRYDTNNLTILQFDPAEEGYGTYKVRVYINASTGANTYFGLVWW